MSPPAARSRSRGGAGTAFGPHGKACAASFSTSYEKLVEATSRMERFVEQVCAEQESVPLQVNLLRRQPITFK